MEIVKNLSSAPELDEMPLPAALPGEVITATKLHRFRLRQLQDLAQAYGIALPADATKNEVLPILVTHERAGLFRQSPRSRYHLLRAEINHDEKLDARARAEREQRIREAEGGAVSVPALPSHASASIEPEKPKREPREIDILRIKCKAMGINSFGKKASALRQMIKDKEKPDVRETQGTVIDALGRSDAN